LLSGDAEGPAGTGTGPNRSIVGPARSAEAEGPETDPGEEVVLIEAGEVFGLDFGDGSLVDDAMGNLALLDEMAQPGGLLPVKFVVVDAAHG
jgi:hypothetical protein